MGGGAFCEICTSKQINGTTVLVDSTLYYVAVMHAQLITCSEVQSFGIICIPV